MTWKPIKLKFNQSHHTILYVKSIVGVARNLVYNYICTDNITKYLYEDLR